LGSAPHITTRRDDQRQQAHARHRALIAAHADYEHHLWLSGDPRGYFGQFPPAF
jgi:hypothetical protein